jgi:hypothetical protein
VPGDAGRVGVLVEQQVRGFELQHQPGQAVRQHVVDLPGDAGALGQRRRPGSLLDHDLTLGEQ